MKSIRFYSKRPRVYRLRALFATEASFWEWISFKHYLDNKPTVIVR